MNAELENVGGEKESLAKKDLRSTSLGKVLGGKNTASLGRLRSLRGGWRQWNGATKENSTSYQTSI